MTMATAMVSPSARPRPRMMAPTMPMRALRSTPMRIISSAWRRAPAPLALRVRHGIMTSRVSEEMMGRIMTARIHARGEIAEAGGIWCLRTGRSIQQIDQQRIDVFPQQRHEDCDARAHR